MNRARTPPTYTEDFYTDLPVGEILRRARLQMGLSIDEAAQYLYIRSEYLESLERSDFNALPGRVYVIGFIRTYAEFLGLDGGRVINLLKRQSQGLGTPQSLNIHLIPSESRLPSPSVLGASFAGVLVIVVLWGLYQNDRIGRAEHVIAPPPSDILAPIHDLVDAPPDLTAPPEALVGSPVPAEGGTVPRKEPTPVPPVRLVLLEESWVEIRSPDGRVAEARVFRKGEIFEIETPVDEFGNAYAITVGNAAGVQVQVEGKPVPPLGGVNKVRRNVSMNPKTLRALLRP